jgi:hypothetical protein
MTFVRVENGKIIKIIKGNYTRANDLNALMDNRLSIRGIISIIINELVEPR